MITVGRQRVRVAVHPPVNGRIMRRLLPNAELHVFHDGHLGLVTSARELAPVIEELLPGD